MKDGLFIDLWKSQTIRLGMNLRAVVSDLSKHQNHLERLLERISGPHPQSFKFSRSGVNPEFASLAKFPDDVDAAVPRTTVNETPALEKPSLVISYPQPDGAKNPSIHLFEFLLWNHVHVHAHMCVFIIDF